MFVFCQECGARLAVEQDLGRHECNFDHLVEFQIRCARDEMETGLESQVAVWACEPSIQRRLAFARYLREHTDAAPAACPRARRARRASAASRYQLG